MILNNLFSQTNEPHTSQLRKARRNRAVERFFSDYMDKVNPIVRSMLMGTIDPNSPFSYLRGHGEIIQIIWNEVFWWMYTRSKKYLKKPPPSEDHYQGYDENIGMSHVVVKEAKYIEYVTRVVFPKGQDLNINMLPFILGNKESLPEEYHHYWPMIEACDVEESRFGKVGYLTIHESQVLADKTQRRPGLHTEAAGTVDVGKFCKLSTRYENNQARWGTSLESKREKNGGLYIASNVDKSTRAWNLLVQEPEKNVDFGGSIEHFRFMLKDYPKSDETLMKNSLYWLTDLTPHEAIPIRVNCYRQFFRLVAGDVTVWYDKHSTANRLGTKPDAIIILEDKFANRK